MCNQIYFVLLRIIQSNTSWIRKIDDKITGEFCVEEYYDKQLELSRNDIYLIIEGLKCLSNNLPRGNHEKINELMMKLIEMLKED